LTTTTRFFRARYPLYVRQGYTLLSMTSARGRAVAWTCVRQRHHAPSRTRGQFATVNLLAVCGFGHRTRRPSGPIQSCLRPIAPGPACVSALTAALSLRLPQAARCRTSSQSEALAPGRRQRVQAEQGSRRSLILRFEFQADAIELSPYDRAMASDMIESQVEYFRQSGGIRR
jgi:hypothetical protein